METVIETRNLTKQFGSLRAVDEVNFTLRRGQIYGLIGKNGAGKTTLMRMIAGFCNPTRGEILINGSLDLNRERHRLGTLIETPAFYPHMSALSNMKAQAILRPGTQSPEDLLKLLGIWEARKRRVCAFSLGMKQRLGIALALLGDPDIVLLDEPINGLDPAGIHELRETLKKINLERGVTFVISSHILDELAKLATHFGIVDKGKLIAEFSASSLQEKSLKSLVLRVSDREKARELLASFEHLEFGEEGDLLRIYNYDDPAEINKSLVMAGLGVRSLNEEGTELEKYFLSLTGTPHDK